MEKMKEYTVTGLKHVDPASVERIGGIYEDVISEGGIPEGVELDSRRLAKIAVRTAYAAERYSSGPVNAVTDETLRTFAKLTLAKVSAES